MGMRTSNKLSSHLDFGNESMPLASLSQASVASSWHSFKALLRVGRQREEGGHVCGLLPAACCLLPAASITLRALLTCRGLRARPPPAAPARSS